MLPMLLGDDYGKQWYQDRLREVEEDRRARLVETRRYRSLPALFLTGLALGRLTWH